MQHRRLRRELEQTTCPHCGWRVNNIDEHLIICPMNICSQCPTCKQSIPDSHIEQHKRTCRPEAFRIRRVNPNNNNNPYNRHHSMPPPVPSQNPSSNGRSNVRIEGFMPDQLQFDSELEDALMQEFMQLISQSLMRKEPMDKKSVQKRVDKEAPAFKALKGRGDCSICLGEIKCKTWIRKLKCGHLFHKECLDQWLEQKQQCPYCRAKVLT